MEIRFYVVGAERKAFAMVVGELVGWEPVYKKAPTFAYAVNNYIIDKNGTLIINDSADRDEVSRLLEGLAAQGYVSGDSLPALPTDEIPGDDADAVALPAEDSPQAENVVASAVPVEDVPQAEDEDEHSGAADDTPSEEEPAESDALGAHDRLSIELPWEGFTEQAYNNLVRLVESKAGLICKSIGAEELVIQHDDERICFPWFAPDSTAEEVAVYTQLVAALCEMAKTQQRVTATSREVENPKYAMRCFLLRLCFIGDEYAAARKLLLRNLSGNSSFKSGARKEHPADTAPNPADSAPLSDEVGSAGDALEPPETAPTGGDNGDDSLAEALADAALVYEVNASFVGGDSE